MDRSTSLYLDFCRFAAALTVFCHHFFHSPFYEGDARVVFGRQAVVVFFVISGFVIAYVTAEKENSGAVYCANRASRLYSVVLPALLLTLALDGAVKLIAPPLFDPAVHNAPFVRFFGSLLFLNQSWNLTMASFSNGPFWSLCYEFWYYVVFGLVVYGPRRAKIPLATLAALVAGPRIILLLPVWLFGVAAYRFREPIRESRAAPLVFVFGITAFLLIALGRAPLVDSLVAQVKTLLVDGYLFSDQWYRIFIGGDANFPADYALGLAFALSIITVKSVAKFVSVGVYVSKAIRFCASYTFSLYLLHVPLLVFFAALTYDLAAGYLKGCLIAFPTLLSIWIIGSLTEQRRGGFRTFFVSILNSPKVGAN